MSDNPEEPPPPQSVSSVRSVDYRIIFANHSRMRVAANEISLAFGFVDQVPGGSLFIQELATLVLTPQHAKLVALSLTEAIKLIEQQFGVISTEQSPVDQATLQAAITKAKAKGDAD